MSRPRLLLLDEPSLGLAPMLAKQIFRAIRELNERDRLTVFLVEQNAFHALKLAHRGYVIVNGDDHACRAAGASCCDGRRCARPISKAGGTKRKHDGRIFTPTETLLQIVLVTGLIGGGAAWLAGRAIAQTWRPFWHVVVYMALLGAAVRFVHFALFEATLLSLRVLRRRYALSAAARRARLADDARRPDGDAILLAL